MNQVWLAFITGLTTGGISCFAVQGGLLAGVLSNQKETDRKLSTIYFLVAKLVGYAILGGLLGLLGSALIITPKLQGLMQIFAGVFMIIAVGRILDIHPIFRRFTFTPPKFLFRILRVQSKKENYFAPAILGFLTILIPCGVTQAMMLLSVASGNVFWGGLILAAFILGTSPVFYILGVASNQIFKNKSLKYVAAIAIFILGIMSINTGQILRGSVHTIQNYWLVLSGSQNDKNQNNQVAGINAAGRQEIEIEVSTRGYKSSTKTLKAGVPVTLKLSTKETQGCSRAFTIPEYNISKILPESGTVEVDFTPTKTGRLTYTCSMGMYTGYFDVI